MVDFSIKDFKIQHWITWTEGPGDLRCRDAVDETRQFDAVSADRLDRFGRWLVEPMRRHWTTETFNKCYFIKQERKTIPNLKASTKTCALQSTKEVETKINTVNHQKKLVPMSLRRRNQTGQQAINRAAGQTAPRGKTYKATSCRPGNGFQLSSVCRDQLRSHRRQQRTRTNTDTEKLKINTSAPCRRRRARWQYQ